MTARAARAYARTFARNAVDVLGAVAAGEMRSSETVSATCRECGATVRVHVDVARPSDRVRAAAELLRVAIPQATEAVTDDVRERLRATLAVLQEQAPHVIPLIAPIWDD